MQYLEKEGVLTDRQFGFRTGGSCMANLLSFYLCVFNVTTITLMVVYISLDLKKAFDKVPPKKITMDI